MCSVAVAWAADSTFDTPLQLLDSSGAGRVPEVLKKSSFITV
jgi:hypothetical protein